MELTPACFGSKKNAPGIKGHFSFNSENQRFILRIRDFEPDLC